MVNKKTIGIVIRSLKIGGAEKQSVLLAKSLAAHYRVFLFIQYPIIETQLNDYIQNSSIHLILLRGNFLQKIRALKNKVRKANITHLFAYLSSDNVLAALAAFQNKNCKIFGGIRSSRLPWHKYMVLKFLHQSLQEATIFNNHSGRNHFLKKGFKTSKSIVIPNCTDFKSVPKQEGSSHDTIYIISVGRFVSAKDYPTSIEAIKRLVTNDPKVKIKYIIIGFGKLELEIRNLISSNKLSKHIEVVINPDNLKDYYNKADIYLCSSDFEGLSNSIMEALSFHLPVIATHVGDNPQLVKHNHNGILIPKGDPDAISDAILQLYDDEKKRLLFGTLGFKLLQENYSPQKFTDRYISLIEQT
ncbi:MAG: glycosyltransferase family 4 protein [Marinilabiliaceae bacterium]|nr:glycosyltransferase family 4 protein [Marinilabiliaceae bacterium]